MPCLSVVNFTKSKVSPTPLKNCAIATLQPHNSSPRLSGQWNIHISSSKSEIISFRVPGAHNYNYFLNSLPQLNGELAYRLTKSIYTITMMKWILMLCNLCKTSYNALIHSHVIILELKFWGEFRFPEVSISVNVDLWNEQFYSKEQTSIRQLSETLVVLVVFLHLNKGLDAWGKFWISPVNSLRKLLLFWPPTWVPWHVIANQEYVALIVTWVEIYQERSS